MPKLFGLAGTALIIAAGMANNQQFAKYPNVEAYEIRPGVLAMPKYTKDGKPCEVGLERLHYTHEKVSLDSTLSTQVISQIVDELVPPDEKGPRIIGPGTMIVESGSNAVTLDEFKNISIQRFGNDSSGPDPGQVVVVIRWKGRACK